MSRSSRALRFRSARCVRSAAALGLCTAALTVLPGCVVFEIRDQLAEVNSGLTAVNTELEGVNARLASIDDELAALTPELEPLPNLERLQSLGPITTSLEEIDAHLLSLRKSLAAIDGVVPFLNFGGDDVEEPEETPEEEADGAASDAPAGDGGG